MKEIGNHSFSVEDAVRFGSIEKALIYKEIYGMVVYKIRVGKSPWVYYSASALAEKFPYLNPRSIERWLRDLVDDGHLLSCVQNKIKYDKTKSYTLPQIAERVTPNEESVTPEGEPIPSPSTSPSFSSETKVSRKEKDSSISFGGDEKIEYKSVPFDEEGNEIPRRKPTAPTKDAQKVYALFKSTVGISNPMWTKNKTERTAAQTLFESKGLDKVQKILEFWLKHKDDQFCPDVTSPYKLASKWEAMIMYRKKNGL